MIDHSNGYEAVAAEFAKHRERGDVGTAAVRSWATRFAPGAEVLDLGCGTGVPIARMLAATGLRVFGVDASPAMVAAFSANLPQSRVACESIETSRLFDQLFDGAIAWGLLFLLPPHVQVELIGRVAAALNPGGSFLFTAPAEKCTWEDVLTGRRSESLGAEAYDAALTAAGLTLLRQYEDEGGNHYYEAELR